MMVGMIVAVCILSALFLTMAAMVFCELPRDWRDTFCFLVMLAVSVAVVLVFVGDRLGIDLYYVASLAFGLRIFQNLAIIRRFFLKK